MKSQTRLMATEAIDIPAKPAADQWRLFAEPTMVAGIGGRGEVFGTVAREEFLVDFFVDLGIVLFDPSFNRGGDVIRLPAPAAQFLVSRSGSNVTFFTGNTFVEIPVGPNATIITMWDGERALRIDTERNVILLGDQVVTEIYEPITSSSEGEWLPVEFGDAGGRLVLSEGASASSRGNFDIIGTSGEETIDHLANAGNHLTLDPSFNKGGDTLVLHEHASEYLAWLNGSSVVLRYASTEDGYWFHGMYIENPVCFEVTIPVGVAGMDIEFVGGFYTRSLYYDVAAGQVMLGTDIISAEAQLLSSVSPI